MRQLLHTRVTGGGFQQTSEQVQLAVLICGDGRPAAARQWLYPDDEISWILRSASGSLAIGTGDIQYGVPRVTFRPVQLNITSHQAVLLRRYRRALWHVHRSTLSTLGLPQCMPRAYLAFARDQADLLVNMLRVRHPRIARRDIIGAAVRLRTLPDLLLLPASQVAVACALVRPAALFWDLSPARRYFDRGTQVILLPRFAAPLHRGRWHLPGEIDVDTRPLIAPPFRGRLVA